MTGKHHNVYFPAGFQHLKEAMKESHAKEPNKEFKPKTVLCDSDLVVVHSHLKRAADVPEIQVVHMFRITNGKIVEMWDCGQEIPKDNPNADGAF
jgi:predicted SnoaL-like aldol condensation-catalyzing enzyme